jgi:PAS domain-containing protein
VAGKKKTARVAGKLTGEPRPGAPEPVEPLMNYRLLVESSLSGIFIVQDYRFVYVNDAFARMHGYQAEELLGMPDWKQSILMKGKKSPQELLIDMPAPRLL